MQKKAHLHLYLILHLEQCLLECPEGLILYDGECVESCPKGMVYSPQLDTCINKPKEFPCECSPDNEVKKDKHIGFFFSQATEKYFLPFSIAHFL